MGGEEKIVITAAHCLPHLPPPHPARYLEEETYQALLAPLGDGPTIWAQCLFVDPVADIAVLGSPDSQDLSDKADAYDCLLEGMETLIVADAPAQGEELLKFGDHQVKNLTPGKGSAFVLSLEGRWLEGRVERRGNRLAFEPEEFFKCGMSGSPIISAIGEAIGVVSVDLLSPVLVDSLSVHLLRSITSAGLSGSGPI
jgi:Trypsin-like peptidase domain